MDDEICTLEKCDTETIGRDVSQSTSQDYSMERMEPGENEQGSDVTGSMEDADSYVDDITDEKMKQSGISDTDMDDSRDIMDDSSVHSERPLPSNAKSLAKSLIIVDDRSPLLKKQGKNINAASGIRSGSQDMDPELVKRLQDAEARYNELETRFFMFEEKFNDMQKKMTDELESKTDKLSTLEADVHSRAHDSDHKRLKQDFDMFSKRLRRVVQAEDSLNAESLDPTKVPPDVLEITYAKTLNDLFGAMIAIYGDRESADMVENARDRVREFSAGVDFFRFEDEVFVVRGLSDAISSKIVSVKQIHGTYVELFKMLFQHVPNYNSQDFRSFVETGSREYTIEKVVSHERHLEKVVSDLSEHKGELGNLTENVSFIAELQNNQLEETASNTQQLEEIKEQMKSIAKAVNLHTKVISKLNRTLKEMSSPDVVTSSAEQGSEMVPETSISVQESAGVQDMTKLEEMVTSKASKAEIMAIAGEIESFKAVVGGMFNSLQEQLHIHIPGYEESLSHVHPETLSQDVEIPLQDYADEITFPEGSADISTQAAQVQQEEFLSEPVEAANEPDQIFADGSLMQAETTEFAPEPLGLEDFAPDAENIVPDAESMPLDNESVQEAPLEFTPEEAPLDLESLDLGPDDVPVGFDSPEIAPEEVPLDLESLDLSPDEVPVGFDSPEDSSEEVPLDLESLDISPDDAPVGFESPEFVPEEVPLDPESLDLSPDDVPVGFDSPEVVPEEVPLDLESLDLSPADEPVGFDSPEVVPEEVPLDLESLDLSPADEPVGFDSPEVSPEEVPLDLESLDLSPADEPVGFDSPEVSPEEVPLDLESLDLSLDEVPAGFDSPEFVPEEVPLDLESLDLSPENVSAEPMEWNLSEAEILTQEPAEQPRPIRLKDMPIEEVIMGQLSIAGSATLKQLEKQITASGYPIDFEKLSLVMGYLEQEKMVDTVKKGRYTFYSVAGTMNV